MARSYNLSIWEAEARESSTWIVKASQRDYLRLKKKIKVTEGWGDEMLTTVQVAV